MSLRDCDKMTEEEWLSMFTEGHGITESANAECRQSGDWMPVAFDWLKHAGYLCALAARLDVYNSPAVKRKLPMNYAVLIGQLNRCARLNLSCQRLICDGSYGETYQVLERCISETLFKFRYLIKKDDDAMFKRFICSGLQKDVEALEKIRGNIANRGGTGLPIENRMKASIERYLNQSCVTEAEVKAASPFPDYRSVLREFGLDQGYTFLQSLPSQSIHGTWCSLFMSYLEYGDDGLFRPSDASQDSSPGQLLSLAILLFIGLIEFFDYVLQDADLYVEVVDQIETLHDDALDTLNGI